MFWTEKLIILVKELIQLEYDETGKDEIPLRKELADMLDVSMIADHSLSLKKECKERLVRLGTHSVKVDIIDAVCINCNKRFKSIHAFSMYLRVTGARHTVNIINHGYYDKKTGLREMNSGVLDVCWF